MRSIFEIIETLNQLVLVGLDKEVYTDNQKHKYLSTISDYLRYYQSSYIGELTMEDFSNVMNEIKAIREVEDFNH